ncbi:MAG: hypothetical protein JST00_29555 [Deltaproteobacteria bacterium]|nr:hypothetical protein [Deltaproteobacteria bacterium]
MRQSLVLVLASAGLIACSRDTSRETAMRSSLTAIASALETTTYPRPVSRGRTGFPGRFGDHFFAKATERAALEAAKGSLEGCARRLSTSKSASDASGPECVDLARLAGAADALLDLGRSEEGGAPIGAGPFQTKTSESLVKPLLALCHHSAASVLADTLGGRADAAASRCSATMEVMRDFAYGGTVLATTGASSCVEAMADPCRVALEATTADAKAKRRADLAAVAASMPPFADAVLAEMVRIELETCGALLGPTERDRLGPRARAVVAQSDRDREALPARERSMHVQLCLEAHQARTLVVEVHRAAKGSPERAKAAAAYQEHARKMAVAPPSFEEYERRYDVAKGILEALGRP